MLVCVLLSERASKPDLLYLSWLKTQVTFLGVFFVLVCWRRVQVEERSVRYHSDVTLWQTALFIFFFANKIFQTFDSFYPSHASAYRYFSRVGLHQKHRCACHSTGRFTALR